MRYFICLAILAMPTWVEAKTFRRSCTATGAAVFRFQAKDKSGATRMTLKKINIKKSDQYVVAVGTDKRRRKAKEKACGTAVESYRMGSHAGTGKGWVVYGGEVESSQFQSTEWLAKIGCGYAAAGKISGFGKTSTNRVSIRSIKIVASASRDNVSQSRSEYVDHYGSEGDRKEYLCWEPPPPPRAGGNKGGGGKEDNAPKRSKTQPPRAKNVPERAKAPPERAAPLRVLDADLTIVKGASKGCPQTPVLRADFITTRKGKVEFWVRKAGGGKARFSVIADKRLRAGRWRARYKKTFKVSESTNTKYMVEVIGFPVISEWVPLKVSCGS